MTPRRDLASLLSIVLLASCGGPAADPGVTVRDSGGVTIIEHSAAAIAAAPAWSLGAPTVTIGGGESEEQSFSFLSAAARLADGRLVLTDNDQSGTRLLVYGADGTFERRVGRNGEGPGEFRNARLLGVAGDTLIMYDFQSARVTRMSAAGALIATVDLTRLGQMKIGIPSGVLGDGRVLTAPVPFGDTTDHGSSAYRQAGAVLVIDPQAVSLDTLMELPGSEVRATQMNFGGQSRSFPAPLGYGKRTLQGNGPDQVHVATNATSEVATYRLPWAPVRLVRFALTPAAVDQAARDAQIAAAVANIENSPGVPAAFKTSMLESVRNAPFADSMAAYQSMLVGTDGSLWLREMRTVSDSVAHMLIVGTDGHLAARADLPRGARLLWTDGAQALVALADENDLPRLELRPVSKGPAAP